MIKKKINEHLLYYISLFIILFLGFILIISLSVNKSLQLAVFIVLALFYVIWGLLHHYMNHELMTKVVVEYILIASLGVAIMLFLLKGGYGI